MTGAGAVGLLAGCSQGGGDTTTTTDGGGGGGGTTQKEWVDHPIRGVTHGDQPFTEWNMNWQSTSGNTGEWRLFALHGNYAQTTNDYFLVDLDEIEIDQGNNEFRFTLKDDIQWHKGGELVGAEVNAEDTVLRQKLAYYMLPESARTPLDKRTVTGWRAEGSNKKTLVLETNTEGANMELLKGDFLQRFQVFTYRDGPYKDYLESIQSASSSDEKDKVRNEVINDFTIDPSERYMSGPWMVDDVATQRMLMKLNKDHWNAEKINWDTFEYKFVGTGSITEKLQLMIQQDEMDLVRGNNLSQADPPENVTEVYFNTNQSIGLNINYGTSGNVADSFYHRDNFPAARLVRQAIGYALDNKAVHKNAQPTSKWGRSLGATVKRQHGLAGEKMVKDLFPDLWEKLPTYDRDQEKAAAKLREAGCTKDGGTWYKPNGDPLTLTLQSFSWRTKEGQTVQSQLDNFGMQVELETPSDTQLSNGYWGTKEYTSLIMQSQVKYGPPSIYTRRFLDPRFNDQGKNSASANHPPAEWKVPPIGEFDAEPTETINTLEMFDDDRFAKTPEGELTEDVKKLVWVHAYHLPTYDFYYVGQASRYNNKHFNWPEISPDKRSVAATADMPRTYGIDVINYNLRGFMDEDVYATAKSE